MANPFCHVELHSNDPEESKKFYGELLGWEFEEHSMGDSSYTLIKVGEGTGGGIVKNRAPDGTPPHWIAYILVDDIDVTTNKARDLGATILHEPVPIPGFGAWSVIKDPSGAVIALWKAESQN